MRPVADASGKTFTFFILPFAESTSSLCHRHGIASLVIDDICLIPRHVSRLGSARNVPTRTQ
jgi:hypothetical protein